MRGLSAGGGCSTEEGIKDITKAEVKSIEASPEKTLTTAVTEAVIGGALINIGEYLVGLVDFLELLLSTVSMITVRVILKCQLAERLPYILVGGVSADT